jgi:hypothetical protein
MSGGILSGEFDMTGLVQSYILTAVLSLALAVLSVVAGVQLFQTGMVNPSVGGLWITVFGLLNAQAHAITTTKVVALETKLDELSATLPVTAGAPKGKY